MNYQVSWTTFDDAASLQLTTVELRQVSGWQTWHFRAAAESQPPLRSLFSIDDRFDSYSDRSTLESRQYEFSIDHSGKEKREVIHLLAQGDTLHGSGPAAIVLPGTRDPLGALYALRLADWTNQAEVVAPVYDGHDLYEMRARREAAADAVSVPAGNFTASRISIHAFRGGQQLSGVKITVWIANNPFRTPVQIQAALPFGSFRASLVAGPLLLH